MTRSKVPNPFLREDNTLHTNGAETEAPLDHNTDADDGIEPHSSTSLPSLTPEQRALLQRAREERREIIEGQIGAVRSTIEALPDADSSTPDHLTEPHDPEQRSSTAEKPNKGGMDGFKEAYHRTIEAVNSIVGLPAKDVIASYPTPLRTYGGYFKEVDGELRYYIGKTVVNWVDRVGDKFFRTFDDHRVRDGILKELFFQNTFLGKIRSLFKSKKTKQREENQPEEDALKDIHPVQDSTSSLEGEEAADVGDSGQSDGQKSVTEIRKGLASSKGIIGTLKQLITPKRSRRKAPEVYKNAVQLGLGEEFSLGSTKDYLVINDPEHFKQGIMLLDIIGPSDVEDPEARQLLEQYDLFEAIAKGSVLLGRIHQQSEGGIGEFLPHDVMFTEDLQQARILPPDIVYYDNTSAIEQKALDVLDFAYSTVTVRLIELQKSKPELTDDERLEEALTLLPVVLDSYPDSTPPSPAHISILEMAISLDARGRFALSAHNNARLGFNNIKDKKGVYSAIRKSIFQFGVERELTGKTITARRAYQEDNGPDTMVA